MTQEPLERFYRTYPYFLRHHFGFPVYRVSINAGFTCPNRDGTLGTTGCIYCNNESFSPPGALSEDSLETRIEKGLRRFRREKFIVYFQSYSNTYGTLNTLRNLYERALSFPGCVGLSIGTRPDCVDSEKLAFLESLAGRTFLTVEYGLQSPHEASLRWMKRGHGFDTFAQAVVDTAGRGILVCVHIILGIPGETLEMMRETARVISELPIDLLKIHQLQVIKGTVMAQMYEGNPFPLWNIDEYADFLCDFLEELREDMVVQRLYSLARPGLLMGPDWGKSSREIDRFLHSRIMKRKVVQGSRRKEPCRERV